MNSQVLSTDVALEEVKLPAAFLMASAIVGMLGNLTGLAMNVFGIGMASLAETGQEQLVQVLSGGVGMVGNVMGLLIGGLVLLGALKMKALESYGWAVAASVIAMIPCVSPCCCLGMPFGIWALVVLVKPEVKAAFAS